MNDRPLLEVVGLHVSYPDRRRGRPRHRVHAVRGVDLEVERGEVLGLVGESGSGKSTLARALVGVLDVDEGRIRLEGTDLAELRRADPRQAARRVQMVFQDFAGALDPRQRVGRALSEVWTVHPGVPGADGTVTGLLERVGLAPELARRFPHQLSGGQRQRVSIARALAVEPEILILDEPVSALDVSVQARILSLLDALRRDLGLTLILISHDLAVVRNVSDRVAVMHRGDIVETGPTESLFAAPGHPYTSELLRAVPRLRESATPAPAYDPGRVGEPGESAAGGSPV